MRRTGAVIVLAGMLLLGPETRPARACGAAKLWRHVVLGESRGRVVLLRLDQTREFHRRRRGRMVWHIHAALRLQDRTGRAVSTPIRVGGYGITNARWKRDIGVVVKAGLARAARLPAFRRAQNPRAWSCGLAKRCGPVTIKLNRKGRATLMVQQGTKRSRVGRLDFPRDFVSDSFSHADKVPSAAKQLSLVHKKLRINAVVHQRLAKVDVYLVHLFSNVRDFDRDRAGSKMTARNRRYRCRTATSCAMLYPGWGHSTSFEQVVVIRR